MKRLPFALVAISLSIPVVACLNSSAEDDSVSGEDNLSAAVKKECNFGFAAATTPLGEDVKFGPAGDLAQAKRAVFADINGDGKTDFVVAVAGSKLQTWLGNGDGTFKKGELKAVSGGFDTARKRIAVETVAAGDFDKDGFQDIVVASTTIPKGDAPDPADVQIEHRVLFGKRTGELAMWNQNNFPAIKDKVHTNLVGDVDGDGIDDLIIATPSGETVMFGGSRDLVPGATKYENLSPRTLAFITPATGTAPPALVIATADKLAAISFDKTTRAAAKPTETSWSGFSNGAQRLTGDLDGNGSTEISLFSDKLTIASAAGKAPLTFDGLTGRAVAIIDLNGAASSNAASDAATNAKSSTKREIVYGTDTGLFAACGYSPTAKALGAAPLAVAYDKDTFVAGTPDLNGDGKPDFVTLPKAGGALKVYLAGDPLATPPELTVFNSNLAATDVDAGSDATTTTEDSSADATTGELDATVGSDATTGPVDAGHDATTTPVDAGHDAGHADAGHPKDAGTTTKDAGTKPDSTGDDDDDSTEAPEPPDGEGSGKGTKKPTTKPSTGTSTGSVTITPKPQAVNDGCSAAPGTNGVTSSAFGGIFAAMMLLARRSRRSKKA